MEFLKKKQIQKFEKYCLELNLEDNVKKTSFDFLKNTIIKYGPKRDFDALVVACIFNSIRYYNIPKTLFEISNKLKFPIKKISKCLSFLNKHNLCELVEYDYCVKIDDVLEDYLLKLNLDIETCSNIKKFLGFIKNDHFLIKKRYNTICPAIILHVCKITNKNLPQDFIQDLGFTSLKIVRFLQKNYNSLIL